MPKKLKAILDALDGLSDPEKEFYVQGQGDDKKYYLDFEGQPRGWEPASRVAEFRANNTELLKFRTDINRIFGARSADDVKGILEKIDAGEELPTKEKANVEKVKADMAQKHKVEVDRYVKRLTRTLGLVQRLVLENGAVEAISKAKGNSILLKPHVIDSLRMKGLTEQDLDSDDELKPTLEVIDRVTREPRIKDGSGSLMNLDDLVGSMRTAKDFMGAFEGTGASGSGADGSADRSGGTGPIDQNLPPSERLTRAFAATAKK